MAINYPSSLDGTTQFPQPQGSSLLTSPDHASLHTNISILGTVLEGVLGTTNGTSVLKNFTAGNFPIRQNVGGTVLDTLVKGTLNNFTIGTPTLFGTVTLTNGTIHNGVVDNAQISNPVFSGASSGTIASVSLGTPTLIGNGTIAMSGTTNPIRPGAALAPTVGTASDSAGGTITVNAQAAQLWEINCGTAAGNRTIGTPNNLVDGQFLGYRIKQNTNNTGTILWSSIFRGTVNASALGTQSTWNYYGWRYNATDAKLDFQGNSVGLI